jgi:hypothetical protein
MGVQKMRSSETQERQKDEHALARELHLHHHRRTPAELARISEDNDLCRRFGARAQEASQ